MPKKPVIFPKVGKNFDDVFNTLIDPKSIKKKSIDSKEKPSDDKKSEDKKDDK